MNILSNSIEMRRAKANALRRLHQFYLSLSAPFFHFLYLFLSASIQLSHKVTPSKNKEHNDRVHNKKAEIDLVICVVAGPGQLLGILDLLDSAKRYLDGTFRVIIVDDSCTLKIWLAIQNCPEVDYLRNWRNLKLKGLYNSLQKAYVFAIKNYRFKALLRVDTDALITGHGLIKDIACHLAAHPEAGMLGSYRVRCSGARRDFSTVARQIQESWSCWKEIVEKAKKNGYEVGEHALGGAYVLSYSCLQDMRRAGYLNFRQKGSYVSEDGIFSLFVRALGYTLDDFAYHGPFAISWRDLPIPNEEVVRQGKKVIHSVKFTREDLQIRAYFRRLRSNGNNTENQLSENHEELGKAN